MDHWKLPYFNGFTASNLCPPPYCRLYSIGITHIPDHRVQQKPLLCLPNCFTKPPLPHSATFSELSSKCHSVCYKSCNSSLCLQVVAFCAETNLVEVCCLSSPHKKKKHFSGVERWDDLPFGCFLTFSCLPVRRAASIRSSIRLTSIHQSTISDDTGLESSIWITWRSDGYEEGRRALSQVLWVETLMRLKTFGLRLHRYAEARSARLGLGRSPPLPVPHSDTHTSVTGMNTDRCSRTQVQM